MRISNYVNNKKSEYANRFIYFVFDKKYQLWDIVKLYSVMKIGLLPFPHFDLSFAISFFEAHV